MKSLHLAIVEPEEVMLRGLQAIITSDDDKIEIVGSFESISDCDQFLKSAPAAVLLIDEATICQEDLYAFVTHWTNSLRSPGIIVMSHKLSATYVEKLFCLGVLGFLYRDDCTTSNILTCIRSAALRRPYVSPQASALFYKREAISRNSGLSRLDIDVLQQLALGLDNHEIARLLGFHVRSIYRSKAILKQVLNVKTNDQIVDAARRNGLLND